MSLFEVSIFTVAVGSAALVVGCGGKSDFDLGPAGGDGAKPAATSDALAACSASPELEADPESADDYQSAAVGAWLGCPSYAAPSPTRTSAPEDVGIELSSDGTYALLVRAPDGSIGRAAADDQHGTWYPTNTDGMVATQFMMAVPDPGGGGGTSFFRPAFFAIPRQLRIEEGMWLFHWSRYVNVPQL